MSASCLHPGGLALTRRLLGLHPITADSRLLDIGCGDGASAAYIRATYGCQVTGIEPDAALYALAAALPELELSQAAAEAIPYPDGSFDLAIAECVLSLTELDAALRQIRRVLKPGGKLLFSDLYARGDYTVTHGLLRHLYTEQQWLGSLERAGFILDSKLDASDELKAYLAQMIFEHGVEATYCSCGLDRELIKTARPGYLLIAVHKA